MAQESQANRRGELWRGSKSQREEIVEEFAKKISNPNDPRPSFLAVNEETNVAEVLKHYAPWYIRPFLPDTLPRAAPGVSGEFVYGELGIMAIGVEVFRDRSFLRRLPESKAELAVNQIRGVLFLLEVLSEAPAR